MATRLSESEWHDLRHWVYDSAGIKLSEAKRMFLVSRLLKRLRATGTATFREYFRYISHLGRASAEHQQLVNAVTTNKTDFFREREHFDVLVRWLKNPSPNIQRARSNGLKVWCAATATGEEPYTIAAVLREHLQSAEWSRVTILGTDIDTAVLAVARRAVYDAATIEALDSIWRLKMFVAGSGEYQGKYRVRRDLRQHVRLTQLNLIERNWPVDHGFDVVFCRNVLIYFDRPTQEQVVGRLLERLAPHGLLFLGHAESLNGMKVDVQSVAHAVYGYKGSRESVVLKAATRVVQNHLARYHSEGSKLRRSPPSLGPGAMGIAVEGMLKVRLTTSAMLLIYGDGGRTNGLAHFSLADSSAPNERILREASRLLVKLRAALPEPMPLHAKLVTSTKGVESRADSVALAEALTRLGVKLIAMRHAQTPVLALVEPRTGRIQIRTDVGVAVSLDKIGEMS